MSKLIDLTGQRFGRLVVIKRAADRMKPNGKKLIMWKCQCDCGNTKEILGQSLRRGLTKSCGCLGYENRIKAHTKHGMTNTSLYNIWSKMKQRCNQKNNKRYKDYGGRGISYCREWEEFKTFEEWAYRSGYKDGLSIERINVNGNYCPENCEWIPFVRQARNRRPSLRIVGEDGKERLVVDIAEEIGIDADVVRARYESGWSLHDALYTPLIMQTVKKKVLKIDIKTGEILGEYASIGQAAKDVGVDRSSISRCCSGKLKKSGGFSWKYANKENE